MSEIRGNNDIHKLEQDKNDIVEDKHLEKENVENESQEKIENNIEVKNSSYGELIKESDSSKCEVHHMPPDSVSPLKRNDGPAIIMEIEDHKQTASWGNSKEAREYRAEQKKLIEEGKFREAFQRDIDDIYAKFGDKYEKECLEAILYVDYLEMEGKI